MRDKSYDEIVWLKSEITELSRLIDQLPKSSVIELMGLESRRKELQEELDKYENP